MDSNQSKQLVTSIKETHNDSNTTTATKDVTVKLKIFRDNPSNLSNFLEDIEEGDELVCKDD